MPTNNKATAKVSKFRGQHSGEPLESYGLDAGQEIKNFLLLENALVRTPGSTLYGNLFSPDSAGVNSLSRFKNRLVAQGGLTLALETAEASKAFTALGALDSAANLYTSKWRDKIFLHNGVDAKSLLINETGTSYGPHGMDPPGQLFFTPNSADAGALPAGTYYYLLTFLDERTNSESPAGGAGISSDGLYELSPNGFLGPTPVIASGVAANKMVRIPFADVQAHINAYRAINPRATHFIFYRSNSFTNGLYSSFFRIKNADSTLPTGSQPTIVSIETFLAAGRDFYDNTPTPPAVSLPENNSPPPTPARLLKSVPSDATDKPTIDKLKGFRHTRIFRDQLFGIGAYSPGYKVKEVRLNQVGETITGRVNQFTDIIHGSEVYQPDYIAYTWEVGAGDGQEAVGLGILSDTALLAFKNGSTYYLSGSSPENFVCRIMDPKKGAVHQSTIQETSAGVITLDNSGFVIWSKIGIGETISRPIQDVIDQIQFEYAESFYSAYDAKNEIYYCAVVIPGSTTPNITLALSLRTMEWTYTQGAEGLSRIVEVNSKRAIRDYVGGKDDRILDVSDIRVTSFENTAIESIWTSGTIDFNDNTRLKRLLYVYVRARSAGSWKIDLEVIPDNDESRKFVHRDWDVLARQSTWYSSQAAEDGSLIWEQGVWESERLTKKTAKIPVQVMGETFQIRIINREQDVNRYGFAIEAISAEGSFMGRSDG